MSNSIISNAPECYVCKTTINLHKHHIYENHARRPKSEKYGCWVYLCARHHNFSPEAVHYNRELDLKLKSICQEKWEEIYGNREQFIETFGRSYL